jgi:hypothetical protein
MQRASDMLKISQICFPQQPAGQPARNNTSKQRETVFRDYIKNALEPVKSGCTEYVFFIVERL